MGDWNKPKPPAGSVYVVMPVGDRYGVGLYRPGQPLERVKARASHLAKEDAVIVAARMNARINVSTVEAAELERKFCGTQAVTE